jgi:hypothetical protein
LSASSVFLSGISCAGSIERGGGQSALQISVMFGHPSAFFVVLELPNLHHYPCSFDV